MVEVPEYKTNMPLDSHADNDARLTLLDLRQELATNQQPKSTFLLERRESLISFLEDKS